MTLNLPTLARVMAVAFLACAAPALAQKIPETAPSEPVKPGETPSAEATPAPAPMPAPAPTTGEASIAAALDALAARFDAGEAAEFTALLSEVPAGVSAATLGHLLFTRRHFDRAAWFFGTQAAANPADAAALNNFAAMLFDLHQADPAAADPPWLPTALDAATNAARLSPDEAAVHNTLGNVARALGDHAAAVAAGERATTLAPDEALYWTNLARSRAAAGDTAGAADALARAHALDPNGPAVRLTAAALPAIAAPYRSALQSQCNVDFNCASICPGGIIGGVMRVTCEMESASAQLSCQEGQPYPTGYNCQEEFPEYGILIPGLNSGFSVSLPGFSMHVLVDGNGDVRVRVEAGFSRGRVGAYAGADGTWSPGNGASFDEFRGGVRVNILPNAAGGGSATDQAAGRWGHPPAHIELQGDSTGETVLGVEAYNAGLISN